MSLATIGVGVGKKRSTTPKTTPVRLTEEAIKWARIASGYTGESVAEYVSRIVAEHSEADVSRLHADIAARKPPKR